MGYQRDRRYAPNHDSKAKEKLIDRALEYGLEYDPFLQQNGNSFPFADDLNDERIQMLREKMDIDINLKKLMRKTAYPFKPYPTQQDLIGTMNLGTIKVADEDKKLVRKVSWNIFPYNLLGGVLIGGKPKVGKTTFIYKMIFSIMEFIKIFNMDTSIWIFDTKRDFEGLMNIYPDAILIDSANMFANLLEYNPVVGRQKSINTFTEAFCNILNLWEGSSNLLSARIDELQNIFEPTGVNPTIQDLLNYLPKRKEAIANRNNDYKGSIINRISGIMASTGKILDISKGLNYEEILANKKLVIFSLSDFKPEMQALMTAMPIIRLFNYRMARSERYNYPRNILIIDEAKRIFHKKLSEFSHTGASIITKNFLESREFGLSFILADHEIGQLNSAVYQASIRVMLRLSDNCIKEMSRNLYLTPEQAEYFFHLKQGEAIVRCDSYPHPFVIEIDNVTRGLSKTASEEELAKRQPYLKDILKHILPAKHEILDNYLRMDQNKSPAISANIPNPLSLEKEAEKLLHNIWEHPFIGIRERAKMINFSASKTDKALDLLDKKGIIKKFITKNGKGRGKFFTLVELKKEALQILGKKNQNYSGKGSVKHAFFAHKLAEKFTSNGHPIRLEYLNSDVAVSTPEGVVAYEIVLHSDNMEERIKSNEANGLKSVLIFETSEALENARKRIFPLFHDSVKMELIANYL